eukprot:TRINITY_DN13332_c0_g1_i1.p1 TRINITY_DN13332_c0_g1~~TRINITY_DN13332_c0_g1_i1.p1  ORF type:complete len:637 (-),score=102.40 TRINITY_DN13332_c0_g1_i1:123-1757(-)
MADACGSEVYQRPKLKVYNDDSGKSIKAANLPIEYEGWENLVGVAISNFRTLVSQGLQKLRIEIGIQNCGGTLSAREAVLLDTAPAPQLDYPFAVPTSTAVAIDVTTLEESEFVPGIMSANAQHVSSPFGFEDARMAELLATIRLPQLRFPGGTVGNYYNWRNDSFYNDEYTRERPFRAHAVDQGFKFAFEGYAASMKATGASSVLMFNVIEDSAASSVARLQDRLAHGLTVDFVEMGNENYDPNQGQGRLNGSNVEAYIAVTKELSAALKAAAPGVKTAVNVNHHSTFADNTWEGALAKEAYYDAVQMHPYVFVGSDIFNLASARQVLSAHRSVREYAAKYRKFFSQPLIFTEWGILGNDVRGWIRVLAEADQFTAIASLAADGIVAQAGKHILFGSGNGANEMFFWNDTAFVSQGSGVWYRKLREALMGSRSFHPTTVDGPELDTDLPAVTAFAVRQDEGVVRVIAVNKLSTAADVQVTVNGQAPTSVSCEAFGAELDAWPVHGLNDDPWSSCPTQGAHGKITMPPLSVAVATLQLGVTVTV